MKKAFFLLCAALLVLCSILPLAGYLSNIWGVDYTGETRTVDMHIKTLRQKLGDYGAMIETVRNVGYRLEAKP